MKNKILILMSILTLALLTACNDSTVTLGLSSDFTVICAEEPSVYVKNISESLTESLSSVASENGNVTKILLGDTGREESVALKETFSEETNYKISYDGNAVVIVARSDLQLEYASRRFMNLIDSDGEIVMNSSEIESTISESKGLIGFFDDNYVQFSWENADLSSVAQGAGCPRVIMLDDGVLVAGIETPDGMKALRSYDNGKTWSEPVTSSFYPEGMTCFSVNLFKDGESLYFAYCVMDPVNTEKGFYSSLRVSVSFDGGQTWEPHSTIVESYNTTSDRYGYWEPYLCILNGEMVVFYSNDSRKDTQYQNIEYRVWNGESWGDPVVVSSGDKHEGRDGMPVVTQLSDGTYVCVIESTVHRDDGFPFIVQMFYSKDGKTWTEPMDIYIPTTYGSKAAAPVVLELPNGQIVVAFQTDEDATVKGDGTSVMKTIISDGTPVYELTAENFSPSENVFGTPDGQSSIWNGLYYNNGYLYASSGTWNGIELKVLNID